MQLKICNGIKAQECLYQDQANPEIFFLIPGQVTAVGAIELMPPQDSSREAGVTGRFGPSKWFDPLSPLEDASPRASSIRRPASFPNFRVANKSRSQPIRVKNGVQEMRLAER